jgi:hypothetical protein
LLPKVNICQKSFTNIIFITIKVGKILNSNDLYMANQTSGLIDPDKYDLITECVEAITDLV